MHFVALSESECPTPGKARNERSHEIDYMHVHTVRVDKLKYGRTSNSHRTRIHTINDNNFIITISSNKFAKNYSHIEPGMYNQMNEFVTTRTQQPLSSVYCSPNQR